MFRRSYILILLFAFLLSAGQAHANHVSGNAKALLQVFIPTSDDLARFDVTGFPVFVRLDGDRVTSSLLTGVGVAEFPVLDKAGLRYIVLDTDLAGQTYYFVSLMPHQTAPAWANYGEVLLRDGEDLLLRMTSFQAEALAQTGVKLRALTLTPKPLTSTHAVSFPSVVNPDPTIQTMIDQATTAAIQNYTGGISGVWPVIIGGSSYTIATRNTYTGTPIQKATQYVGEHLTALGLDVTYHQWGGVTYPNVIGELPGQVNPDDIYIIGAHLDDMPSGSLAPGADDNGSGSVATLLAADIFTQYNWGCTLRFAFWTGEEQGLLGSAAYAQQAYNTGENILGYLNMDMIAWNTAGSNPDIDLHAKSTLPATVSLAQLYADVVDAYNLNLIPQIITSGTGASDHASFWNYGFTSILAIEDYYGTGDFNPNYHTTADNMANIQDWAYYTDFVKASLATFAHMTNCLIPNGLGAVDGHVTAADGGAPVAEATVIAENAGGQPFSTTTDASGYYTRTLIADVYTVTASAYGYLPTTLSGVTIVTDTVTTADLQLATAPTYVVSGYVLETGTGNPLLAQVEVLDAPAPAVWSDPATGYYSITLPLGVYTLQATAESHHNDQHSVSVNQNLTQDFSLDPLACILLVDDDNNAPDVRLYYTAALDALGYSYDVFDVGGGGGNGPELDGLQGYPHILWFSGDKYGDSAGPNGTDETILATYLDAGGHLYLSAQDYLYDFGLTSFGQNYLGIGSFIEDGGNATIKYGVAGDPIGGGFGPYPLTYPAGFSDYADAVNPGASTSVAFRTSAAGGNNLDLDKTNGTWKTTFFGTAWETIYVNNASNGEQVLGQILDWFGGCEQIPEITISPAQLTAELATNTTTEQTLDIGNVGTGSLSWSVTEVPSVPWLDETPSSGGVVPGQTASVTVAFDASGLAASYYTTTLQITSNDTDEPLIEIPVILTVYSLCNSPAELNFAWEPLTPWVGTPVTFTASVTGTEPITLTWDFGDGVAGAGLMVTHTFTETGNFTVTLTATNACGGATISHPLTVDVEPPPPSTWTIYLPVVICSGTEQ
ncbi:MAG: M28 family peptidase [Anaerolineales bacterium]|nr:M28 family peptidase [Anaerolineales bacterium]